MTIKNLKLSIFFIVISLLNSHSSFADVPYLGDSSSALWTKSRELEIGKQTYNKLLSQGRIIQNLADSDYLNYLGYRIATYADSRVGFHCFLTNATSINAFASIGGYIGINAGLVLATDNEHELAGVIAHEISHISQRHIARLITASKDRQIANIAAIAASILVAANTSGDSAGLSGISAVIANETQQTLNDIRSHEKEADRIGRNIMELADFDEIGMQTFFGKLYTPEYADKVPAYLLTHPLPQDRQADIEKLQKKSKKLLSSKEYYLFRARLRVKLLNKKELTKLINTDLASSKSNQVNSAKYSQALLAIKYGKINTAKKIINSLASSFEKNRDIQLLRAKLELLSNNNKQAKNIYTKLWQNFPDDSVVAYDYVKFLKINKKYLKAEKILKRQLEKGVTHAQIYRLYSEILHKLGKNLEKQLVLIDYYIITANYEKAKSQAIIALNNPSMNWQDKSQLNSKLKQINDIISNSK